MRFLLLVAILLSSSFGYAVECKHSVSLIQETQPAPCTGFLFSPEAERKATQAVKDAAYYKELAELYEGRSIVMTEEVRILDKRVELYKNASTELASELNRKESQSFWRSTLFFGLGVLVTSLSIYAASQVQK